MTSAAKGFAATPLSHAGLKKSDLARSRQSLGRTALQVVLTGVAYYVTTKVAWALCFPNSKVSLLFPPHAVLVAILLLVPARHWWAYTLATIAAHFVATREVHWPVLYALQCEVFDAVQNVLAAAGIRYFIRSPLKRITLRDALVFVLIAVILVPFGTAFWGAAFTVSNNFGTNYWVEWRNLGISNGVTAVVLVPAFLLLANRLSGRAGKTTAARPIEGTFLGFAILALGAFVFDKVPAGPDTSPALLYAPIPLLIWAALRFGLSGISAAMLLVTFQAIWGAMHGHGPFLQQSPPENALALQMFLTVTGTPLMFLTVLLEDEKRSQRALHEVEERVTLATEAAQIGAWELDAVTNELWISDKVQELFQFGRDEEVTYAMLQARVHPEDRAKHEAAIRHAAETKGGYEFEYRLLLPDGTGRWIAGRTRCVDYGDATSCRLVGVAMDVTKRKEAEELFRLVTEAAPSGILLADADGQIILVNQHLEELFGYKREELIGQPIELLVSDRFSTTHPGEYERLLADLHAHELRTGWELFARRKDGSEFPVEVGLSPIETPQGLLVLASVLDTSARKAAEEEVRRQREQINLLSRISVLGEMTASLAHELNQPLTAVITNANAGRRLVDRGLKDTGMLREILLAVAEDGRRAHEIIQNVRNTVKKGDEIRRPIDLNELVKKVARVVRPDAFADSCEVETSLAKDLPRIEGDPVQLQQVLVNLVSNALDAMRETPLNERKVEISTTWNGDGDVRLGVRDHGTGIRREVQARLFDQFFTTKEQGLGMGLAIVRSIVEAHGGKIEAENVADGGARFYLNLPVTKMN